MKAIILDSFTGGPPVEPDYTKIDIYSLLAAAGVGDEEALAEIRRRYGG